MHHLYEKSSKKIQMETVNCILISRKDQEATNGKIAVIYKK